MRLLIAAAEGLNVTDLNSGGWIDEFSFNDQMTEECESEKIFALL